MANKMQWLVEALNDEKKLNKTFTFKLSDSKKVKGTVCMPTGTGKSGVMIEDIMRSIKNTKGSKLLINVSCPTLRLAEQLITDLFDTIHGVYGKNESAFSFVINSSDSPSNYRTYGITTYSGDLYKCTVKALNESNVVIVASCHRSLQKFVDICAKLKKNAGVLSTLVKVFNYVDEAHMLSVADEWGEDSECKVNVKQISKYSDALYMFSATPDAKITMLADPDYDEENPYIYKMYPAEAIEKNIILPPRIRCFRVDSMCDPLLFTDILSEVRQFGGYRKILITLKDTYEMRMVADRLGRMGYKVFGACAADGFTGEAGLTDAVKFAEAVDAWQGDCFVLQIRQLTQGTDIRTLTDCVIPISNDINPKTYRNVVQTMGRVMRAAPGERGMDYSHRTKKAGNVFFLILPDACEGKDYSLKRFALRYYGMDCAVRGEKFLLPAEMTEECKYTMQVIYDEIEKCISFIDYFVKRGHSIREEAINVVKRTDMLLYGLKQKNIPEYHLLDNRVLIKYAESVINSMLK